MEIRGRLRFTIEKARSPLLRLGRFAALKGTTQNARRLPLKSPILTPSGFNTLLAITI